MPSMANFTRHSTASPTLVMQHTSHYQTQLAAGTFGRHHPIHMQPHTAAAPASFATPSRFCGRKRSREEASKNLEPDPQILRCADSKKDCNYEEGTFLFRSSDSHCFNARSQFETRMVAQCHEEPKVLEPGAPKGQMRFSKYPKIARKMIETTSYDVDRLSPPSYPISGLSSSLCDGPEAIDNLSLQLGIGWRRIGEDEHIQAAARGWARFIENHYGLSQVRICLESKGLQSYLVEASDGYFLFVENLRRGRLVSRTVENALRNLTMSPLKFEGPELNLGSDDQRHEYLADSAMMIDQ